MSWSPNTTVTVNGTSYTSTAVIGGTVTYGRTQTNVQPRAGYANISVIDTTDAVNTINIGDTLVVKANNYTGTPVTLFTGTISDVVTTVVSSNTQGTYVRRDLIGVGLLARLNRRLAGSSGYAAQDDGDRVAAILSEIYNTQWTQVPATQTWATTSPTLTWATYDADKIGTIDQPGVYALAAYTSGTANAYDLATTAAQSGLGVLYDTPAGPINYDDADHRETNALTNGYWTIPIDAIESAGLSQSVRLGDVTNIINLTYASGTITVTDAPSVTAYGPVTSQVSTVLANFTDATEQASRYLGLTSQPNPQFDTLSLAVHQPNLSSSTVNTALSIYNGKPIQVTGLPDSIGGSFTGFVEGWTWRLGQKTADLKLTVSDFARSMVSLRWAGFPPTIAWNTIDPTLDWTEIY